MSQRTLKKGEVLFKDGDKIQSVYLVQTGGINQCLIRGKKTVDLFQIGASQVLGEQIILGVNTYNTSAVATTETKVLEIPVDSLKQLYEAAPQMLKVIIKSLADRLRLSTNEVRSTRVEKDSSPCPEDEVAKIFGAVYHAAHHKGDTKSMPGRTIMDWSMLKQYCQRIMGEGPKRVEQVTNILVKLQLALYEMGQNAENPEGPEEIQRVHFFDLELLENFFEFYQYYYFKGGRSELLKVDDLCMQMLEGFLKLSEHVPLDRFNVASIEFAAVVEHCKTEMGITLNNDHFSRLESKGVLCKRKSGDDGVFLQFEPKEFRSIYQSWKILKEIDKWNEKGYVDLDDKDDKPKKKASTAAECPQCSSGIEALAKFCPECGHKLQSAA